MGNSRVKACKSICCFVILHKTKLSYDGQRTTICSPSTNYPMTIIQLYDAYRTIDELKVEN